MLRAALFLALVFAGPVRAGADDVQVRLLNFDELHGWSGDDHGAALSVFLDTCAMLDDPQWRPICRLGQSHQANPRTFFELFFRPVLIEDGRPALFTAYYEPVIDGSRQPDARFRWPVYARPPGLVSGTQYYTRAQIERDGVLKDRGLEIAWVDDPVALQFLQIQGSGRIRLTDGSSIRLGYAGNNGHPFRSLGDELVRRGIYTRHQVSAAVISNWAKRNPAEAESLLWHNPSYIFFRVLDLVPAGKGPLGAMNRSITARRTLAVDPAFTPLGAPVWLEKAGSAPFNRLMVAQDTGSRIKGPQRADIFIGTGAAAGKIAATFHDPGRMVVLLPIQRAYALLPEDEG